MAIDLGKIIRADEKKSSGIGQLLDREISFRRGGWNDRKKERFYSELHVLLQAGVDIRTAFEMLESEAEKKEEKELYKQLLGSIVKGSTLPGAIAATGKFSDYEFYCMRIGEESGRMNEVLQDLAGYYAKKIKQVRKVKSALSYPAVVIAVATGAVWFMLRFVVPMFSDMLTRFHTELPSITRWIIGLSGWLGTYGPWLLLSFAATIGAMYSQRKQNWYRRSASKLVLRLPYAGRIVQKIYLERFCHAMHLLLASRTPLVNALALVQKMTGFYPIEKSLETIGLEITRGKSLHESLAAFPVYNRRMISLIRVAEEVNQLDLMFGKLSQQYTEEIEHETSVLGSMIEPLMIVFLGLMVAVILIAMYLPMFRLSTAFG